MNKPIRLMAVGDIFVGDHPVTLGHGVGSMVERKGAKHLFRNVAEHLRRGDIVFGNLETIVGDRNRSDWQFVSKCFRGRPEVVEALKWTGFNVLSLANNHSMQHGTEVLRETIGLLDEHGIMYSGVNESDPMRSIPAIFDVNGTKVALLAYSMVSQQYHLDTPLVCKGTLDNIRKDVCRAQKETDIVVVSLHWGDEFVDFPSPEQARLGRALIDAGVHLVLGHHSHVLQGVERYRHGLIVYSLGSFVKDLWQPKMRESIILECEITRKGIGDVTYTPIYINDEYQPVILEDGAARDLLTKLNERSQRIENVTLENFDVSSRRYHDHVAALLHEDRRDTYLHYLQNLWRYNPFMLLQNVYMIVKRRITGVNC